MDVTENLSYSASRLVAVWPGKFSLEAKKDKALASDYAKNSEKLGNYIYANIIGNGDENSGDGYKYRGRGIFQLTGKANYEDFQSYYNANYNMIDLIDNPSQLTENTSLSVISALWFFKTRVLNQVNIQSSSVEAVTSPINGRRLGLDERKKYYKHALNILR